MSMHGRRLPGYQLLSEDLRKQILTGKIAVGHQLPTESELSASYRVSRQTLRRALDQLAADGLIYRIRGSGTFVSDGATRKQYVHTFGSVEDLIALSADTKFEVIAPLRQEFNVEAAHRLRLETDQVATVTIRRTHDGVPFCITVIHLPPTIGALLRSTAEFSTAGAVGSATVIGIIDAALPEAAKISSAQQSITAVSASADAAELLDCAAGDPLLKIDRLYFSGEKQAVELAVNQFSARYYSYRMELTRRGFAPGNPELRRYTDVDAKTNA